MSIIPSLFYGIFHEKPLGYCCVDIENYHTVEDDATLSPTFLFVTYHEKKKKRCQNS